MLKIEKSDLAAYHVILREPGITFMEWAARANCHDQSPFDVARRLVAEGAVYQLNGTLASDPSTLSFWPRAIILGQPEPPDLPKSLESLVK